MGTAGSLIVSRVYAVSMKTLCVDLRGRSETIKLEAEKVVDDHNELTLTAFDKRGEKIGVFNLSDVMGWRLEE